MQSGDGKDDDVWVEQRLQQTKRELKLCFFSSFVVALTTCSTHIYVQDLKKNNSENG